MILSMYESLTFLTEVCHLEPHLAQELIELVILSQWSTTRMNGIEWIHRNGHGYTTVDEVLEDALEEMAYTENLQIPRDRLRHAAFGVLVDLPEQKKYWEELNEHGSLGCQIHWRRSDVLIKFM
jgi:hypothetical protein